jgi:adenosylhomocysteine nucleosidase
MIITFSPDLVINTGVGGAIAGGIGIGDIVVGERLVQHDMDTSALGDPKGLISGIKKVYFEGDERGIELLLAAAESMALKAVRGTIATADRFIADKESKNFIKDTFDASICEMEGAAIAQAAYVNRVPFLVIRTASDSADEGSSVDYMEFMPIAAQRSALLTMRLIKEY